MTIQFTFQPVAQNTIIRPLAEAVCMMHGGETTPYTDPTDNREKYISYDLLHLITGLETKIHGQKEKITGNLVAFQAHHYPNVHMQVKINDVTINIDQTTTVPEALAQFHKKLNQKNKIANRSFGRQRD